MQIQITHKIKYFKFICNFYIDILVIQMEAKDLATIIFKVKKSLEKNEGIALFASLKKGFEPWLKVELSGVLNHYGTVIIEETHIVNLKKKRIDIVFNDDADRWAIELKDKKTRSNNVLDNLKKLKEFPYNKYNKTCLVFLTFHQYRKKRKDKTKAECDESIISALKKTNRIYDKDFFYQEFYFNNSVFKKNNEGRLWFVLG